VTSDSRSIRGRFTTDGAPLPGGEVALFSTVTNELLAIAPTDDAGTFTLSATDDNALGSAILVARTFRDPIGVATLPLDPAAVEVELVAAGPWYTLVLELAAPDGGDPPAGVEAFLDPVRPEEPRALTLASGPGAERAHFATIELTQRQTAVRVQAGRWRLGASRVIYERPQMIEPDFDNYVASSATVGADELAGDAWSGFELTADADKTVVLHLRELADDEL
jgi:hypothetical protein